MTISKAREILAKYRKAGQISIEAKSLALKLTKPGANAYEIVQKIENFIRSEGAIPAFPVNFSVNNEAAHYSPEILDTRTVKDGDIIKVDLGAHIDGYIVDTAVTINFNKKLDKLVQITAEALERAIEAIKHEVSTAKLGSIIEKTIVEAGFQPIRNLSGHQIKRYNLHAGVTIPNHGNSKLSFGASKLQRGKVYAIEPFASTGNGMIRNGRISNIFRLIKKPKEKDTILRKIFKSYYPKIGVLPFSPRFMYDTKSGPAGKKQIQFNLRKLRKAGFLQRYPVLIETNPQAQVSQFEHTIIVKDNGCEVLTREE